MLLCVFALCDIDVDAYHPLWMTILTVRNYTARFDPSDLTTGANNPIIYIVDVPLIAEGSGAIIFQSGEVFWVHPGTPLSSRRLGSSLRQTVYCGITLRNRHSFLAGIIRMAADKSCLCCQCQLCVELSQGPLRFLTFTDIDHHVDDTHDGA